MNETVKQTILEEIRGHEKIAVYRHRRPDGDAIGAARGLALLLRAGFPEKDIRLVSDDRSDYVAFLGADDPQPEAAFFESALAIIVDAGTKDRISGKGFEQAEKCIKIDHHRDEDPYGDISWVEPERSSAAEMIADLWQSFPEELVMTQEAALCLYTGMVTDTDRFRFPSTGSTTLRLAAALLEQGIDTETLFSRLRLEDFSYFQYEAYIFEHMQQTEHGVVYLFVTREMQKMFSLSSEKAGASVNFLDGVKGGLIWLVFIEQEKGVIRVRLRSRFTSVRELASRYRGGGHDRASGATVYSEEEARQLLAEADELVKNYKETHEDWL